MDDDTTEKPKRYLNREETDPIRLAQEARAVKAEARAEMTPRQQELLWGREKLEEVLTVLRYGKRRTILGFIQNTSEVTPQEKMQVLDTIQATVNFLRQSVSSTKEQTVKVPVPDFLRDE